ncbi:MAG: nickel pincer cofactor biosynthesis protein LarB [Thermoplasmata archaeon]
MNEDALERILEDVRSGKTDIPVAKEMLSKSEYENIGFACVDHQRTQRKGFPEVIYCPGKSIFQIVKIAESILDKNDILLATRADEEIYEALKERSPEIEYNPDGKVVFVRGKGRNITDGNVLVITAGTSDIPVAEEAAVTAQVMGCRVEKLYDVGVAGVHRLLDNKNKMEKATVIIVVAGMEGALASVVGGLVSVPVIAVPTSVGYGASFQGLSALLTMLNSCASGVTVVNIDNGFGAGYAASQILHLAEKGIQGCEEDNPGGCSCE